MTRSKWLRPLVLLLALVLIAAACGGRDDDDETGGGGDDDGGEENGGEPQPTDGFDGTTITVGAISATSGRVAIIGNPLTAGNQAYFDQLNAEGGVAGKYPVELLIRDGKYEAPASSQEYQATKGDVVMYAQILGTPIVSAVLPDLTNDGIVAGPASLDSFWVREQSLLPIGGPYQIQMANGLDWYLNEDGGEGTKVCSLTQDDAYGEAGQQGLDHAAEELDVELGPQVPFTVGTTDYTTQINQLQGEDCEAVALVATPADAAGILGRAAQSGYAPRWIAQSPAFLKLLFQGDLRAYAEENVVFTTEGPAWGDESVPGMVQIIEAMEEFAPEQEPDIYFTFGYAEAWAAHQLLEAAVENGDLSHEGIIEAMNGLDGLDFGGLLGDYEYGPPEDRNPPRASTIAAVDIAGSPTGLTPLVTEYLSDAAESFSFDE